MENWVFLGGGAALATLAACWSKARMFLHQILSRVIVTCELHDTAAAAMLSYLQQRCAPSRFRLRTYVGWMTYVRPARRVQTVAMETLGKGLQLYWVGWRPLLVQRVSGMSSDAHDQTAVHSRPLSLTYVRGLFDADQLVLDAVHHFNEQVGDRRVGAAQRRYRVHYCSGTAGKPVQIHGPSGESGRSPSNNAYYDPSEMVSRRLLQWQWDQIGPDLADGDALDRLALTGAMREVADEVRFWLDREQWHRERGLPWRRGYGLYGPPGTGKTCFVRAIGESLDLPIYSYDLATLYNDELRREWSGMLVNTPCIALLEDLDGVFHGRETVVEDGKLSFDCLLNCLDGIERANGLLVFVTTNHVDKLDEALVKRPGRLDRMVELGSLDAKGRRQIASRILADWPDCRAAVVAAGDGDTGARFEWRCIEEAQKRLWASAARRPLADTTATERYVLNGAHTICGRS